MKSEKKGTDSGDMTGKNACKVTTVVCEGVSTALYEDKYQQAQDD